MTSQAPGPHAEAPQSPFFVAWARFVIRFRWLCLLATLAITAMLAQQAGTKIRVDTSVEAFLATKSQAFETLEDLRDDFGRDEMFLVVAEGDVFSMPFLERLKALHEELGAIDLELATLGQRKSEREGKGKGKRAKAAPDVPDALADDFGFAGDDEWGEEAGGTVVDEITSLINVRRTTFQAGALEVGGLLDDWPTAADLPELRRFALSEPSIVGRVVGKGGRHASILVRTDFMSEADSNRVHEEIGRIVARHQSDGFKLHVGGLPALAASLNQLMMGDLARMAGAGVLVMLLVMGYVFRHPLGVIAPLLVVVQAVIWCFGMMALTGTSVTMISNILPVFIICVGIGDSVHILSVYRDARQDGLGNSDAIVKAIGGTGVPVLFTTLTTCIGLLSFRLASVDAIQAMGTFGAVGVAAALLHSLVFLPAMLTFNRKSLLGLKPTKTAGKSDRLDAFLRFCDDLSKPASAHGAARFKRRNATLMIALSVTALALGFAVTLRVYHNPISWVPRGYSIRDAFDLLDTELGGTADLTLLIEAKPGKTLRDHAVLTRVDKLEDYVKAYQHPTHADLVGNVVSVLDVLRESNRATHEGDQGHYRLPDTQRGVSDMLTLFENAGPAELTRLATIDLQRAIMVVRLRWMDASSYAPMVQDLREAIDEYIGDQAVITPTGAVLNLLTIVDGLLSDLLRSFGTAFVVITVLMILLLRDIRLGLIAMVPNLLPIAVILGVMAALNIPIDMNNILLGSIAIGIAVDDTIHFLHQFKRHMHKHGDVEAAITHAFDHAGRAIVTTSVILVGGFSVFVTAQMYNVVRFGLLIALTLLVALLVDLIFTPALLRAVYRTHTAPEPTQGDAHAQRA